MKNKPLIITVAAALAIGAASTVALQTFAQQSNTSSSNATANPISSVINKIRHAPLGKDGNVTGVSGTTITMTEEADEGGASYTIDASKASFSNNGATAQLSDIKVGDKVFVEGTVSGNNVAAISASVRNYGRHKDEGKNGDGDGEQPYASEQSGQ